MGYTGAGLNQARAHLHLELNLMLNHNFQAWYDAYEKKIPNHNGIYNGINLAGLDIARLYLALRKNPKLTIPKFLAGEQTFYRLMLPRSASFELPKMYPWMAAAEPGANTKSWIVSFTRSSLPIKIEPSDKQIEQPQLIYIKESTIDYSLLTQRQIAGHSGKAHLAESGQRLMQLLIYPE
jgi:hypothetical protein